MKKKIGDIFKQASKEGMVIVLPFKLENGKISKQSMSTFELLQYAGESDNMFTITEKTKTKLTIEISKEGVRNIANELMKMESDIY